MKKALRLVAGSAIIVALGAPFLGAQEVLEQILVKVNGDIITKTELEQRQIAALRERMRSDIDPESLKNDEQLRQALADITPRLLVDAIDELLLVQLGREKNLRLTDDQFQRWLSALRKEQNLEDDQKFQAALAQEGMSLADLRRNVERQFLISEVQRMEIGSKLQITEEEARQYYLARRHEFVEPASVTLREIFIEVPAASTSGQPAVNVAQDDEAAGKASAVRARVTAGEDFATVAAEVSDSPSKANGGLIGPIQLSEISESLRELLEKMNPGDITEPIRTPRGYQILKLEVLNPAQEQPFEAVRDVVADRVYGERQRTEFRRFMSRIRSQALIVWRNDELKKAYEQQVAMVS